MSSHQTASPDAPYRPVSQLRRSRTDRTVAGVAGGLGRYAGIDPLIFRVLFVVLAIFGAGSGILLYLIAWLFVPEEGHAESEGQRLLNPRGHTSVWRIIGFGLLALVALAMVGAALDNGPGVSGFGVIVVLGVVGYLLLRQDDRRPARAPSPYDLPVYGPVPPEPTHGQPGYAAAAPAPSASTQPTQPVQPVQPTAPSPTVDFGQTAGTAYSDVPHVPPYAPAWSPPPPPPPKQRSPLGLATLSTALLVMGAMVSWNSYADDDFKAVAVFATGLAVIGIGLLVSAFAGRARWLVLPAIPLAMATAIAGAVDASGFSGGIGEARWAPSTVAEAEEPFRLGIGDAELDLRDLPPGSSADVEVSLGVGELTVIVPEDARVILSGEVSAGDAEVFGERPADGTDIDLDGTHEPDVGPTDGVITLDVELGLGDLEVRR
jgi:phage shock protein PspC (stress-responsive transcriptional regulator)